MQETEKNLLYLADLTHTGTIVASNVAPLGIGLIAAHFLHTHRDEADVELFKYPSDLEEALCKRLPKIIGFANYSWNLNLSYKFAERIKEVSPETIVVFGGPNYGLTEREIADFWGKYPAIDFYVVKEGELAFQNLYEVARQFNFSIERIKNSEQALGNCHFLKDGELVTGEMLPRIKDLDQLGSPYLMGLMDKFFDNILIPMIHTTRGCPFTCTFCTEGNKYYSKVAKRFDIKDELEYIAKRRGTVQDITITDANFGMFEEDKGKAQIIADIQKQYNWPKRIIVSTGKNQKERVIEVAAILNGAIHVAASLQSTNQDILLNIKRSNISIDALTNMVQGSNDADSPTYTELILGLPGDTIEHHTQSLRDVIFAGLGVVRMYQLILLPQTELNTPETREKYGFKTKFRINPRSFGRYGMLKKDVVAVEHEEILVSHNTLPFEDYLSCRELDLTIEIVHNAGMFIELQGVCKLIGIEWFDLILRYHKRRHEHAASLSKMYLDFRGDNMKGLFDSAEELEKHVSENIDLYLTDTKGTNEIAKYKAIAFFHLMQELHDALYIEISAVAQEKNVLSPQFADYLGQLKLFSYLRKNDFVDTKKRFEESFTYNFIELQQQGFAAEPIKYSLADSIKYQFFHSEDQIETISGYINQYGASSVDSLGRILMRAPAKRLFREFESELGRFLNYNRINNTLNVYGGFSVQ
jgi:radical SAM superfamily enzyme YgiQ (UPF0313 family)